MANQIEILLQLKDQMSAGLEQAQGKLSGLVGGFAAFGGAAAVAGAALVRFASNLADEVEQLDNLSARTGVTAQNLQVLQFAFKQGGVDTQALTQGLTFMERAIANNDPSLAKLGVTSRDSFQAFMQAAHGLSTMSDSADRAKTMFDIFGRGGTQLLPIMNQLAGNFDGVARAAEESGNVLSEKQLKTMHDLDAATDQLNASMQGFGKQMAAYVAPSAITLTGALSGLLSLMRKMNDEVARGRSEERRVGKECPVLCRSRWSPYH